MKADPEVVALSKRQLEAYNRADLEAFCACYHDEVEVLRAGGEVQERGLASFRKAYESLFARFHEVRAEVSERLVVGPHVVERETWSRIANDGGQRTGGELLVRYTALDGRIRWVQFFLP